VPPFEFEHACQLARSPERLVTGSSVAALVGDSAGIGFVQATSFTVWCGQLRPPEYTARSRCTWCLDLIGLLPLVLTYGYPHRRHNPSSRWARFPTDDHEAPQSIPEAFQNQEDARALIQDWMNESMRHFGRMRFGQLFGVSSLIDG